MTEYLIQFRVSKVFTETISLLGFTWQTLTYHLSCNSESPSWSLSFTAAMERQHSRSTLHILLLPYYIAFNLNDLPWSTKMRAPWEQDPYFHWSLHPYSLTVDLLLNRGPIRHSIHVCWQNKLLLTSSLWNLAPKNVLDRQDMELPYSELLLWMRLIITLYWISS